MVLISEATTNWKALWCQAKSTTDIKVAPDSKSNTPPWVSSDKVPVPTEAHRKLFKWLFSPSLKMIHKKYHLNQKRSHVTVHWMPTVIGLTPLTELADLCQNTEQGTEIAWYHSSGFERLCLSWLWVPSRWERWKQKSDSCGTALLRAARTDNRA